MIERALEEISAGRFKAAGRYAEEGARLAEELDRPEEACRHHAILAWVDALQGNDAECRDHARAACEGAARHNLDFPWQLATVALGELELGLGRFEEALAHLTDVWETAESAFLKLLVAPSLVEAALRDDRRELAENVTTGCAAMGSSPALLARCEALLDGADGAFERAISLYLEENARFDCARTRLLYGETLRRARRRREARTQLHAARATFEKLGASSWTERAATELRGSGVTANRRDMSRLDQLTSQEQQVARLVAAGATNKQVAAQLFLSPRTIDFHLRNVFAKLGITSRIQLAWFDLADAEAAGGFTGATLRRAA
jgi:DNA-binding CsgD family transcriptional regulator